MYMYVFMYTDSFYSKVLIVIDGDIYCFKLSLYLIFTLYFSISHFQDVNGSIPHGAKLSVFFYIHGGSYYMGAGRLYPGHVLASSQNMIVVTFNFRLGPLGESYSFIQVW